MALHGAVITGQVAIAVEHEERRSKQRQSLPKRTRGSQKLRAVEGILNVHVEAPAIPGEIADLLAPIADAKHHSSNTRLAQQPKLMGQKRLALNFDQGLGQGFRQRTKTRRKTSGQDGYGQHILKRIDPINAKRRPLRRCAQDGLALILIQVEPEVVVPARLHWKKNLHSALLAHLRRIYLPPGSIQNLQHHGTVGDRKSVV